MIRWLGRRVFPADGIKHRTYEDIQLYLHPRDWIEYWLLRGDDYEPLTLKFIEQNLQPGDVAILAGVNFGLHVAVAARAVGDEGRVIGIEPQPAALLRAAQNLRLNNLLHRVSLVSMAIGVKEELVHMAWPDAANSGTASLLDEGDGLMVSILPLAAIVKAQKRQKVRLLLLDVQGYEAQALAGLTQECLPEILIVEIDPEFLQRANTTAAVLLNQILDLGYSLHWLDGTPVTAESESFPERNAIGIRKDVEVTWATKGKG